MVQVGARQHNSEECDAYSTSGIIHVASYETWGDAYCKVDDVTRTELHYKSCDAWYYGLSSSSKPY